MTVEIKKTQVIFHKHLCFLCHQTYEEVEAGKCQYIHDDTWGKCPLCEENFAVGRPNLSHDADFFLDNFG